MPAVREGSQHLFGESLEFGLSASKASEQASTQATEAKQAEQRKR